MIITCPACNTRYVVSPQAISPEGRTVKCARCAHQWHQSGEEVSRTADAPLELPPSFKEFNNASLPVPQKKAKTPGGLIALCVLLMVAVVAGGLLVFEEQLRAMPQVDALYAAAGLPDSYGLELGKIQVQAMPGRRYTRYFVTGEIKNVSEEPVMVAGMRVSLKAEDGNIISYTDYTQEDLVLEAGSSVPFSLEEKSRSENVAEVMVDLGNPLEIMER